jgi:hypothetical protein
MKNLIFQYYLPYDSFDKDMGGATLPDWAQAGSRSAQRYAELCGAEYILSTQRYFHHLDPRLDSIRLFYDPQYEQYDKILSLDLDMLINTKENIFNASVEDVAMVHELGLFNSGSAGWLHRVMSGSLETRGIKAYGKYLFGDEWDFPKSSLYPKEKFRYLNGGLQLWTAKGRAKAREHFTSVNDYYLHTRYTEQMYINIQLSQPVFNVTELDTSWNRLPYQWNGNPDGKINHFLARYKFSMPQLEKIFSI